MVMKYKHGVTDSERPLARWCSVSAIRAGWAAAQGVLLQSNKWNHPRDAGHENLFVSDGDDPESKQNKIEIASAEERSGLIIWSEFEAVMLEKRPRKSFKF